MIRQFAKYALVGLVNGLIYGVLLYVLTEFIGLWYMASAIIVVIINTLFGFSFNNIWTWGSKKHKTKEITTIYRFLKYCIVGGCSALFGLVLLFLITEVWHSWYILAYLIGSVMVIIFTFIANYYWTWGKSEGVELNFIISFLNRTKLISLVKRMGISE